MPSYYIPPIALTDRRMSALMLAAQPLDPQKRGDFLERVAAKLRGLGPHPSDVELSSAIEAVLRTLIQAPAA